MAPTSERIYLDPQFQCSQGVRKLPPGYPHFHPVVYSLDVFFPVVDYALRRALEGDDELVLLASPADVVLGPRTLVQPDLFVVRKRPGQVLKQWSEVGVPVLAIEFLSPGTAARDRGAKRRIYPQVGIAEYWIVDLDVRLVERWRPADERPEVISETLQWVPQSTIAVQLGLPALFTRVLGPL